MKITLEKDQRIFFTSDTHYAHSNICSATTNWTESSNLTREFSTLDHMNVFACICMGACPSSTCMRAFLFPFSCVVCVCARVCAKKLETKQMNEKVNTKKNGNKAKEKVNTPKKIEKMNTRGKKWKGEHMSSRTRRKQTKP